MQSSDRVLARRYAAALFLSASEKGQAASVRQELSDAYRAVVGQLEALKSPRTGVAAKKELVRKSLGAAVPARISHFFDLLIDKKRVGLLPHIVSDLGRIHDEHHGRVRAQVRAAAELSPAEADTLTQRLKRFSGKDVQLEVKVDPDLLGGLVVRMGDTVLDGSLQGKLKRLSQTLTNA